MLHEETAEREGPGFVAEPELFSGGCGVAPPLGFLPPGGVGGVGRPGPQTPVERGGHQVTLGPWRFREVHPRGPPPFSRGPTGGASPRMGPELVVHLHIPRRHRYRREDEALFEVCVRVGDRRDRRRVGLLHWIGKPERPIDNIGCRTGVELVSQKHCDVEGRAVRPVGLEMVKHRRGSCWCRGRCGCGRCCCCRCCCCCGCCCWRRRHLHERELLAGHAEQISRLDLGESQGQTDSTP